MPAKGQVYTMKNGYDQTMKLLQSGTKFTAIYAISDTLAIGACKAIFDYGLRVPDDISVVGCDGLDMARYYQPAITTIEQPLSAMALETSRILFELIREKGGKKKHIFEARIREGQSVRRI
jgi:LacI family transcriptional regulator